MQEPCSHFPAFNNCVARWRWVSRTSRDLHLCHSQPLNRVMPPWLENPRPPAMSPHANGTRYLSHWFISGRMKGGRDGGKRMIQRLNIPPTLLAQIMKKQRFAQKPSVAKDNKDRKLPDRTAKNSGNPSHVNRMIQRLNKESGCQENVVLSTWRWCKQGWLSLSQMTDRWPHCTPCC